MAVRFEAGEELVWNPSPRLAKLFLAQVRALEEALGARSGVGELVADEVVVEPQALLGFVSAIGSQLEDGSNATACSLFAGAFALSYGLLSACGATLPTFSGAVGNLALRGRRLVSGQGRPGPIYDGLENSPKPPEA